MKSLIPLGMFISSLACGDTSNYNITVAGEQNAPIEINNCDEFAARDHECNPQRYQEYLNHWGVNIEDQIKMLADECSADKMDYFGNAPELIVCFEQNSCDYIKAGGCAEFVPGI